VEGTSVPFIVEIKRIMISKDVVSQTINEYLQDSDLYLVDVKITPDNRISIEIDAFRGVSLDDCIGLNRFIESKIDREIEDYELEVSSAGLSEPFKVLKQYEKNIGKEVEVLTVEGKKLNGVLSTVEEEQFGLTVEKTIKQEGVKRKITLQEELLLSYKNIKTTKLIIRFK
jgi:ribosome maturation factor RimP